MRAEPIGATRIQQVPNVRRDTYTSGIGTRCPRCGGPMDLAQANLLYCDWCGRWFEGEQAKAHRYVNLREVPM